MFRLNSPIQSPTGTNSNVSGLRREVSNLKTFLMKIIENYDLPDELNSEIRSIALLPEEFSPARAAG